MRLVILESPYAAPSPEEIAENLEYARRCMRDCFLRGDAPYASHLLYTQPGVLVDTIPAERACGIEAGLLWGVHAEATVVYVDRGISRGMRKGIERAEIDGRPVEYRWLEVPEYIPRPAVPPPSHSSVMAVTLDVPTPRTPSPEKVSFFSRFRRR